MLTTEQVTQTLEQAITRYEELDKELANVDGKIRERDALRNQIDWLQAFPGLGQVADEATQSPQTATQVVEQAAEVTDETAADEDDAPAAEPEPIEVPDTYEGLRKLKVPELKAIAKQEGIEVSGNKSDIVDELFNALFDTAQEDEGEPEVEDGPGDYEASVPDGFTSTEEAAPAPQTAPEAAPAPQAAPEPAPAPQAKPSPFTF